MADARLLALYRATHYEVLAPEGCFVLRVDEPSPALAVAHRVHGVECSAFLTAWNPHSRPTESGINLLAQQSLLTMLEQQRLAWWPGRGTDPAGHWPAEDSVLVFGMDAELARRVGAAFDQGAVLVAAANAVPRLLWL